MQLSFHADYACRVLIYLAMTEEPKSSIEEIARVFQVSENHLVKVVHRLGKLNFITTTRGRGGGISLARPPEDISMGSVIREMEPRFDVVECFDPVSNTCPINGICGLKPALMRARDAFLTSLDGVMLADVTVSRKPLMKTLGLNAKAL